MTMDDLCSASKTKRDSLVMAMSNVRIKQSGTLKAMINCLPIWKLPLSRAVDNPNWRPCRSEIFKKYQYARKRQGDLTIELVRGNSRVSDKSYCMFQCFGCTAMMQIGLLNQSIDYMLMGKSCHVRILLAFTTKPVLIARNSK